MSNSVQPKHIPSAVRVESNGGSDRFGLYATLVFVGILLAVVGIAVLLASSLTDSSTVTSGAVIIIGPIPIVFGSGPDVMILLPFAVALTGIAAALFLLGRRKL